MPMDGRMLAASILVRREPEIQNKHKECRDIAAGI